MLCSHDISTLVSPSVTEKGEVRLSYVVYWPTSLTHHLWGFKKQTNFSLQRRGNFCWSEQWLWRCQECIMHEKSFSPTKKPLVTVSPKRPFSKKGLYWDSATCWQGLCSPCISGMIPTTLWDFSIPFSAQLIWTSPMGCVFVGLKHYSFWVFNSD